MSPEELYAALERIRAAMAREEEKPHVVIREVEDEEDPWSAFPPDVEVDAYIAPEEAEEEALPVARRLYHPEAEKGEAEPTATSGLRRPRITPSAASRVGRPLSARLEREPIEAPVGGAPAAVTPSREAREKAAAGVGATSAETKAEETAEAAWQRHRAQFVEALEASLETRRLESEAYRLYTQAVRKHGEEFRRCAGNWARLLEEGRAAYYAAEEARRRTVERRKREEQERRLAEERRLRMEAEREVARAEAALAEARARARQLHGSVKVPASEAERRPRAKSAARPAQPGPTTERTTTKACYVCGHPNVSRSNKCPDVRRHAAIKK